MWSCKVYYFCIQSVIFVEIVHGGNLPREHTRDQIAVSECQCPSNFSASSLTVRTGIGFGLERSLRRRSCDEGSAPSCWNGMKKCVEVSGCLWGLSVSGVPVRFGGAPSGWRLRLWMDPVRAFQSADLDSPIPDCSLRGGSWSVFCTVETPKHVRSEDLS